MINSEELNNRRAVNNSQDTKQQVQENKTETRLNQINSNSPEILTNPIYTPAFLRQQIGKLMRIEFLIGTNNLTDRIGFLEDVGASYILLRSFEGDSQIYADIYAIKLYNVLCEQIININDLILFIQDKKSFNDYESFLKVSKADIKYSIYTKQLDCLFKWIEKSADKEAYEKAEKVVSAGMATQDEENIKIFGKKYIALLEREGKYEDAYVYASEYAAEYPSDETIKKEIKFLETRILPSSN